MTSVFRSDDCIETCVTCVRLTPKTSFLHGNQFVPQHKRRANIYNPTGLQVPLDHRTLSPDFIVNSKPCDIFHWRSQWAFEILPAGSHWWTHVASGTFSPWLTDTSCDSLPQKGQKGSAVEDAPPRLAHSYFSTPECSGHSFWNFLNGGFEKLCSQVYKDWWRPAARQIKRTQRREVNESTAQQTQTKLKWSRSPYARALERPFA